MSELREWTVSSRYLMLLCVRRCLYDDVVNSCLFEILRDGFGNSIT